MGNRPAQIRYLTEGKALGAAIHKGFAATWNWVLSFVNTFKGGNGCKIVNANSGNPRVDVLIESGDGIEVTCAGSGQPYVISLSGGDSGGGDSGGGGDDEPEDPDYPDAPEITAEEMPDGTHIYADGAQIAVIPHGKTPVLTASKSGKTTTIFADGVPLCTIEDGADGQDEQGGSSSGGTEITVITGISFSLYQGQLTATLTKSKVRAMSATSAGTASVKVCDITEVDVVTSEAYSTSTHQFTNERKTIKTLGATAANGETPFTATSLAEE